MTTTSTTSSRRWLAQLEPDAFGDLLRLAPPADRPKLLRGRFEHDRQGFCRYLWPDRFGLPFSRLHEALFALQDTAPWYEHRAEDRRAVAAPRGFAKSTLVSFAGIVHDIVYGREACIVLLSAGHELAKSLSRDLLEQFRDRDGRLASLYGPFIVQGGVEGWEVSVRGRPSVAVIAKSFGTQVRGIKHPRRGVRPTKIVVDDGERPDRVRNPDQRASWWQFLTKDVLKAGRREGGTMVQVVGTTLHPDSMLSRLLKEPGWAAQRWQALPKWPTRMDLWERCRAVWADLSLGKWRQTAARRFYESHRAEMDAGAEVLDPAAKDLFALFEILWTEGLSSFLSELQNEPVDPTAQIFWSEKFARFRVLDTKADGLVIETAPDATGRRRRVPVSSLRLAARWDPSTGSPHDDFAAIAVVGRDQWGYSYALDVWMRRARPSEQLAAAWTLAARWGLRRMTVESNGFQALVAEPYEREREARRERGEYWQLQVVPEPAVENKELRIATLEPDATNGWLLFSDSIERPVLEQFDQFPSASHDDGPDAVHGAWKDCGGRAPRMETRSAA